MEGENALCEVNELTSIETIVTVNNDVFGQSRLELEYSMRVVSTTQLHGSIIRYLRAKNIEEASTNQLKALLLELSYATNKILTECTR